MTVNELSEYLNSLTPEYLNSISDVDLIKFLYALKNNERLIVYILEDRKKDREKRKLYGDFIEKLGDDSPE